MPGSWTHLAARFFDVVSARPLDGAERARVAEWLHHREESMFFDQQPADQRHGLECGAEIAHAVPDRLDLIRAALLHDVGKRHSRLGAFGRVLASLLMRLNLPLRGRFSAYARHGELAADELAGLGAEPVVIDFARHHHGEPPAHFPANEWAMLRGADRARLPRGRAVNGYAVDGHQ